MNSGAADSFDYCAALVRRLDEDRWLSAHYAAPALRQRLLALYALHLEITEIPSKVSEAPLGEIRLQWWREALEEIARGGKVRAHPVVEAVKATSVLDAAAQAEFAAAIEARSRLFYDEPFADLDDLEAWLRKAEAYLTPLGMRIAGAAPPQGALRDAATATALARHGALLAPVVAEAIPARVNALLGASFPHLKETPAAATPAILHLALARHYLSRPGPLSPLKRRLRLFAAMASGRF